jgi:hypothetical protein
MAVPPDPIIPTATADQPGQTPAGDYLAPPRIITGSSLPLSRSLPILLLCALLFFNGMLLLLLLLGASRLRGAELTVNLALSGGLLIVQIFAIFRSHKWPTPALWLALAVALAGFFIQIT